MTSILETSQSVRADLVDLQKVLERLRGEYVNGIEGPDGYVRATALLDELTDGHDLNKYEEMILIELEDAILAYEKKGEQFQAFNAEFKARSTPLQLLKDLMETLKLTGSDLPEIGDKTVVSKVLNGDRQISHKMAFALAQRFNMDPRAFAEVKTFKARSTRKAKRYLRTKLVFMKTVGDRTTTGSFVFSPIDVARTEALFKQIVSGETPSESLVNDHLKTQRWE